MSLIEKDSCIICLCSTEDGPLLDNTHCKCKFTFHEKCMKNMDKCPICLSVYIIIPSAETSNTEQTITPAEQTRDSCAHKAIVLTIIILVLTILGYFSAVLS